MTFLGTFEKCVLVMVLFNLSLATKILVAEMLFSVTRDPAVSLWWDMRMNWKVVHHGRSCL